MYKNIYVKASYIDEVERSINACAEECDSITEARKMANEKGYGFAIRAYYASNSGDLITWQDMTVKTSKKKGEQNR